MEQLQLHRWSSSSSIVLLHPRRTMDVCGIGVAWSASLLMRVLRCPSTRIMSHGRACVWLACGFRWSPITLAPRSFLRHDTCPASLWPLAMACVAQTSKSCPVYRNRK